MPCVAAGKVRTLCSSQSRNIDNPYHYPITIRLEPVEGEPINGDEMFVARCEHFPELAMADGSPQRAYDGLMAMIEKVWAVQAAQGEKSP